MTGLGVFRELADYSAWANERILGAARDLPDAALDRPFEMGYGSLRRTLLHILAGEHVWLERSKGNRDTPWPDEDRATSVADIAGRFAEVARGRAAFLAQRTPADVDRRMIYRDSEGPLYTASLRDMLLQAAVHSQIHRAQALNMLRHLGAALPVRGCAYIFMRVERAGELAPPLELATIGALWAHCDWARDQVHAAAARLPDDQLDRPFEMGCGTLRQTLLHIRFAEQWWYQNWTRGPGELFPEMHESTSIAELIAAFHGTAESRRTFLAGLSDADLARPVQAQPRPNVLRAFPLGVTMLQLCLHGTHHRAQAVNMLRRVGAPPPELDYMKWKRQPA